MVDLFEGRMKQTPTKMNNVSTFKHAIYLFPTVAMVAGYNATKLRANVQLVASSC